MPEPARVVVLAGGVGGSRFVSGVRAAVPQAQIDVIVNTADDITMHGLRICPDLDTMTYTLGGAGDTERGWGRADEGWRIMEELRGYGAEPTWFALGDRDIATHLVRSRLLAEGATLTEATSTITARWLDEGIRLLPMSDDPVETHVLLQDGREVHFQEFWVRLHAPEVPRSLRYVGIERARPSQEVLDAIAAADAVLVAPSNPVVSIGPILAVPGLSAALLNANAPIIGFSGIVGGSPVLGMAHRLLPVIGVEVSALGVARHYGARPAGGLLDAWLMDTSDGSDGEVLKAEGFTVASVPLMMTAPEASAAFIRHGLELV